MRTGSLLEIPSKQMAISNELSSDVAAAILTEKKSPQELKKLKDIILQVHSALQKMSEDTRADRFRKRLKTKAAPDRHT
jgi:predicted transcriptional regulator